MMDSMKDNWTNVFLRTIATQRREGMISHKRKLYKYYSLDSEYTILNLDDDIVYLAGPLSFNDPFDCNIGISVDQLFKIALPEVWSKLMPELDMNTCERLCECIWNDLSISDAQIDDISAALEKNEEYNKLKERRDKGEVISDEETGRLFVQNPELLEMLLSRLVGDNVAAAFKEKFINRECDSGRLFSFQAISQDPDKLQTAMNILEGDDDYIQKIVLVSRIYDEDISYDQVQKIYNNIDDAIRKIRDSYNNITGISCFCESSDNILMWSHYAAKHTGICVEYDFSCFEQGEYNSLLLPIEYTDHRPLLPLDKILALQKKPDDYTIIERLVPDIVKAFLTKSTAWRYEREWRLLSFDINNDKRKMRLPIITKIIAGVNISNDNLDKIRKIAEMKNVPLIRTRLKGDAYKIEMLEDDSE